MPEDDLHRLMNPEQGTAKSLPNSTLAQGDTSPSSGDARRPDDKSAAGWIGRSIGKYQIAALIGVGGMGVVYKAQDSILERDVALKLLPADLASDKTTLQRFLAE